MNGTFRIGGALALGTVIVLGALYVQGSANTNVAGIVVAETPERSPIPVTDTDKDGTSDWEESLQGKVLKTIETPTSTVTRVEEDPYEPPTTFTGKFSEAFFKDYLDGKIKGQDFSEPTAFVGSAVEAIEKNTQSKRHSRLELTIIADSPEAFHAYGNEVSAIMKRHSINNENEATILGRALAQDDPKILEALTPIHAVYAHTIADSLQMEVPESFALHHINLLNAYEAILTDIEAMRMAFTDPLYALARVKGYEEDSGGLFTAFQNIATTLRQNGTTYTNDEPGTFFYLFDV